MVEYPLVAYKIGIFAHCKQPENQYFCLIIAC